MSNNQVSMHDQFVKINKTHKSPKAIDKDTQYILACCEMILEFQNNFPLKNDSTEIWQLNVQRKPLELFLTLPHVHLQWNSAVTQTCTMKLFKTKSAIFIPLTILMSDRVLFTKSTVVNMYPLTATSIPVDTKPSVEFHTLHARRYIYIYDAMCQYIEPRAGLCINNEYPFNPAVYHLTIHAWK